MNENKDGDLFETENKVYIIIYLLYKILHGYFKHISSINSARTNDIRLCKQAI